MARKSRKHPELLVPISKDTVGYIRLSVFNRDSCGSVENQKLIIEEWGKQNKIVISRYYIDNGFSGKRFDRPAFQEMIQDIQKGKIDCVVVKDLSRIGRDYINAGYYIEIFFPSKNVRFVSINDQFDTTDGITNRDKSAYIQSSTRVPLINLFNERVAIETKMKVEVILDMKAQHGEFIGPRAPFGYQKSNENPSQLIPDPVAAVIVRKIFEMAASGTGVTGIVRHLNERGLPTPIQYARAHGLDGDFDDGNGSWNSRSVKYILTNRTYTGMLVQGKEKRAVEATHEPLVDPRAFDAIQKAFQARAYNVVPQGQSADNILKGKVICGCCGGKMQRKRGTGHADWHFFTCITKNRLGADKCAGMYAREEDIFNAIYRQLKDYVNEYYITNSAYKQKIQEFTSQISDLTQRKTTAWINAMEHYEQYVQGKISKEEFRAVQDIANQAKEALVQATEGKVAYEKQYTKFRKLLSASSKDIPLSEIMDCIEKVVVDSGGKIVVDWSVS
ncbi:recombinase family protein [Flavonifractor plautii]|uniref:recombinase family protein n=1 Tax=Flavonifractor plautii TaxID=292800 RepID=UPI00195823BE|nr:recombinase family protein [Flavonifractor plautii]MBM6790101.1 recombinase family protein [Flavonifractor plautii]